MKRPPSATDNVRLLVLALETCGDRIGRETLRLAGSLHGWSVAVSADVTQSGVYVVGHGGADADHLDRDAFLALLRREWLPRARRHLNAVDHVVEPIAEHEAT